ncbi:hypothetical protein CfE428DRAFT_6395 [Chthoniobacter flavus Ellin428]|uniref:Uncharacterized protein n=1 Tax=Chthoniobacter flavus Ellin428 TaxID=497964 RepID=B4DBV4_9BACT|nr:hypothetical protein CfE428DRAFT_6395 [Chthoniobacter flavus Ellin428]TCO83851.1 hypothetical protein EV701_1407 [Chthoniobacter flavus]
MRRNLNPLLKWGCLIPLGVVLPLVFAAMALDRFLPSAARRALPASASDVQEYYSGTVDYVRCLKAKLPEGDVVLYARNLNLTSRFDPVEDAKIASMVNIGIGDAPKWWNPPSASASSYFRYAPGKERVEVLRYSNGYVYYLVTAW